jgi:hypothetical protein
MSSAIGTSEAFLQAVAERVRQQLDLLIFDIEGLRRRAPELTDRLIDEASRRIASITPEKPERVGPGRPIGSDEDHNPVSDDYLLELLRATPDGLAVEALMFLIENAGYTTKRPTLVMRLHRLKQGGRVSSLARGHYGVAQNGMAH